MNTLEKFFNALRNTPSADLKGYTSRELIKQLPEFEDHTLYILKNLYTLLISDNSANRVCGARILNAMPNFEYIADFFIDSKTTDYVYLQYKDIIEDTLASKEKQQNELKKKLKLDHADVNFLDSLDYSISSSSSKIKTQDVEEKKIENVYGFFEAISILLLSPDWYKRHGAFLAHCAMMTTQEEFNKEIERLLSSDEDFVVENETNQDLLDSTDQRVAHPNDNSNFEEINPISNDKNGSLNNLSLHKNIANKESEQSKQNKDANIQKFLIKIEPKLFNIIYEILKNDKFSDFVENKTSAPVRESAAFLLKYIFPQIKQEELLVLLIDLLKSEDWQEQFSGLLAISNLKQFIAHSDPRIIDLCLGSLLDLLNSIDEDIKYVSAEILCYFVNTHPLNSSFVKDLVKACWNQINDEVDIAHSKASVIVLLKSIYSRHNLELVDSFKVLYPCFTSPVKLIRQNVLGLCTIFNSEEIVYLLGESILLSSEDSSRQIAFSILRDKITGPSSSDFGSHFHRIISLNTFLPYREDDFACYDDTFFTKDGIKSISYDRVLSNRVMLFKILLEIEDYAIDLTKELIGCAFTDIKRYSRTIKRGEKLPSFETSNINQNFISNDRFNNREQINKTLESGKSEVDRISEVSNPENFKDMTEVNRCVTGQGLDKHVVNNSTEINYTNSNSSLKEYENDSHSNTGISRISAVASSNINNYTKSENCLDKNTTISLERVIIESIDSDFKIYPSLKKMPLGEFKKIIKDQYYVTAFPMCFENFQDYVRMMACKHISTVTDFSVFFSTETCDEFVRLVSSFINNDSSIWIAYKKIVEYALVLKNRDAAATSESLETSEQSNKKNKKSIKINTGNIDNIKLVASKALQNLVIFFEVNSFSVSQSPVFDKIVDDSDRELFFTYTIKSFTNLLLNCKNIPEVIKTFDDTHKTKGIGSEEVAKLISYNSSYKKDFNLNETETPVLASLSSKLSKIFLEALDSRNISIIKEFIKDLRYNEIFVRRALDNFDISLVSDLLDYSDPSFNILFTKMVLKSPRTPESQNLLSKILISITFKPNKNISSDLIDLINKERDDVEMIVNPSSIKDYEIAVPISVDLRDYQKEGVKWLYFLHLFGLNGILADDMGLGKTVQVLTYMISEQHKLIKENTECGNQQFEDNLKNSETEKSKKTRDTQNCNSLKDEIAESVASLDSGLEEAEVLRTNKKQQNKNNKEFKIQSDLSKGNIISKKPQKCLVICPSSLTSHWKDEIKKYFGKESTIFNSTMRGNTKDIVIATYDFIRKDTNMLIDKEWFILVIDEGHILKNRATALYSKICCIRADRKVILTGTPITNSVDDIFSLFNIILPGYLGTEGEFSSTYGCKITDKNVNEMEKRLESLHKKILPFVMRRLKKDVLKDLPEKIIKDLIVEMNKDHMAFYKKVESGAADRDEELYKEIVGKGLFKQGGLDSISKNDDPITVDTTQNFGEIKEDVSTIALESNSGKINSSIENSFTGIKSTEINDTKSIKSSIDLTNINKSTSLNKEKELKTNNSQEEIDNETAADDKSDNIPNNYESLRKHSFGHTRDLIKAASHPLHFSKQIPSSKTAALSEIFSFCGERKILIFFQFKKTIDFVVQELGLTSYLRLDGSIPASQRGDIVTKFHEESIKYLLLTTSIGGLGLNLTCADTVVFYEHDWNPFNDLQAMDRAHRLGQKNTVNVFRLICKGTIEHKVMNYQNFKMYVASSVVTQQNTEIQQMDTKNLLERFE